MVFVCEPPIVRRKGLLGKLKNLVDAIDDAPNSPNPCMPGCMPCCPPPCVPCCPPAPCVPCCPAPPCVPCCPPPCPPVCAPCPPCPPVCAPCPPRCAPCPPPCPPVCVPCPPPCAPCPPPCQPVCAPVSLPVCVPTCPPCPSADRPCVPCSPPNAMICFKRPGFTKGQCRVSCSKSRELLSSVLITGCLCEKRNGLQDDCPRKECRGRPECLVKPNPICGPSEFANGKHLGRNQGMSPEGKNLEEYQCFPLAASPCAPCCN